MARKPDRSTVFVESRRGGEEGAPEKWIQNPKKEPPGDRPGGQYYEETSQ
jgi:hypothetical protein